MRLKAGSIALMVLLSVLSVFMCVAHVQSLARLEEQRAQTVVDSPTVPETPTLIPPPTNLYRDWETDRKSTRLNSSH